MSSTEATRIVIDNTYGALYIGTVIAMALWGAATIQLYYYFNQFPNDEWRLKILVSLVWALDTTHQGLITHSCYSYLVTNYANPTFLLIIVPSLAVMVEFSAIICFLVQGFLLYRVWRLSEKNIYLVAALFALTIAQFVTTSLYFSKGYALGNVLLLPSIAWLSKLVNSLSAGVDVTISIVLIYLLHRSRTGFKRSETLINRLILFTMNTGAATSICAVFAVIFIQLYPTALIYVGFYVNISKMYTNTLLATLNARKAARDGFASSYNQASSMILSRERSEAQPRPTRSHNTPLAIRVETETMHNADNIVLEDLERDGGKTYDDSEHTAFSYDTKGHA